MRTIWFDMPPPPVNRSHDRTDFVYVLIDAAQVEGFRYVFPDGKSDSILSRIALFGEPLSPERHDATPHLFQVADENILRRFIAKLARAEASSGAVSCLVSPLAPHALAVRLKRRLDARLPDAVDCVNRFFDGRISPHLHACLSENVRNAFFSVATQWLVVGHDLKWHAIPCTVSAEDMYSGPLVLTEQQEAYLIDHCYPYTLIEHFEQTDADLLDVVPREERYAFFLKATQAAARFGINGASDITLFCTLCMTRGARFHEEAPWPEQLASVGRGETSLQRVLKSMHD